LPESHVEVSVAHAFVEDVGSHSLDALEAAFQVGTRWNRVPVWVDLRLTRTHDGTEWDDLEASHHGSPGQGPEGPTARVERVSVGGGIAWTPDVRHTFFAEVRGVVAGENVEAGVTMSVGASRLFLTPFR
jgi:hypothetical protein